MNALVIGFGSAGSRHARILRECGARVGVVSRREIPDYPCYTQLAAALDAEAPALVIIANRTEEHFGTFEELAKLRFSGDVLVEKPVFHEYRVPPANNFRNVLVAYNFRFHPLIVKMREAVMGEALISVHTFVGLHLPLWRPHLDYRTNYSAKKPGGGALRDLTHELDYSLWITSAWKRVVASGGHWSALEIETDDVFSLMIETEKCRLLTIQVNYLDRLFRRDILVNTNHHTYRADLIQKCFQTDVENERMEYDREDTYHRQIEALLAGRYESFCTLQEGLAVIRLVDAAEVSAHERRWVDA